MSGVSIRWNKKTMTSVHVDQPVEAKLKEFSVRNEHQQITEDCSAEA